MRTNFDESNRTDFPDAPQSPLLLITVNRHETQAVLRVFAQATGLASSTFPGAARIYRDLGTLNGTRVVHALSEMGSAGVGAMQQTVDKAIRDIKPAAVIAVGIAFGVNKKRQAVGDILLSTQLQLYEMQRVGRTIRPRGDKPHASSSLINLFVGVDHATWTGRPVHAGLVLSGEKLIDSIDYRNELAKHFPEAIGGEMEGAGLYVASHDHKVDWIVIKAICDWADGKKAKNKDAQQRKAATSAAEFVAHALGQVQPSWVRHRNSSADWTSSRPIRIVPGVSSESSPIIAPPDSRTASPSSSGLAPRRGGIVKPDSSFDLPAPPETFFGRDREASRLSSILRDSTLNLVCVDGMGGVGKSSLVAAVANQFADSFLDGMVWIRMSESSPVQALRQIVEAAMGTEAGSERVGVTRYLQSISGKKLLVVLDNVTSIDEVRALLPDSRISGPKFIITTRDRGLSTRISGTTGATVPVGPLADVDAIQLLHAFVPDDRVQSDPDHARQLVARLGHLPLAVKLAAHLLADNPALSIRELLGRVVARLDTLSTETRDSEPRNHSVRVSLELSLERLAAAEREMLLALGVFSDNSFDSPAMAATAPVTDPVPLSTKLYRLCLLESTERTRWRFHPLISQLARELAGAALPAAQRRMAEYFRDLITKFFEPRDVTYFRKAALGELSNILTSFRFFESILIAELGSPLEDLIESETVPRVPGAFDVMRVGAGLLMASKWTDLPNEVAVFRACAVAARSFGDPHSESTFMTGIGHAYQKAEDFAQATKWYAAAEVLQRRGGITSSSAINNRGTTLRAQGKYAEAIKCFQAGLDIEYTRERPNYRGIVVGLNNIGDTLVEAGAPHEADAFLRQALDLAVAHLGPDSLDTAACLNNVARLLQRLGDFDGAAAEFYKALTIFERELGPDSLEVLTVLMNIGSALHTTGKLDEAMEVYDRAYRIATKTERLEKQDGATLRVNIGLLLRDRGDRVRALRELEGGYRSLVSHFGGGHSRMVPIENAISELRDALK